MKIYRKPDLSKNILASGSFTNFQLFYNTVSSKLCLLVKLPQDTIVVNKTGFNQALSAYPLEQSYKALHKNYQIFLFSRHPDLKTKNKFFI